MSANPQHQPMQDRLAGLLLIAAAAVALLLANSPLAGAYHEALEWQVGPLTTHQWIADAAMALFFLLVGLEVKREWYEGRLSTPAERRLPIVAAAAGMIIPALAFLAVTGFDPALAPGWAIPAATDIAFALGVLALLGARAPPQLKLLLVTIAIIDDVGAVAIIAVAYTAELAGVGRVRAAPGGDDVAQPAGCPPALALSRRLRPAVDPGSPIGRPCDHRRGAGRARGAVADR
jgi:NhaA family Na+:H+ antiporter